MPKKMKLVLLALKMTVIGIFLDTVNYMVCKSAMTTETKHYRFLSCADNLLHGLRTEFAKTEFLYLSVYETSASRTIIKS